MIDVKVGGLESPSRPDQVGLRAPMLDLIRS